MRLALPVIFLLLGFAAGWVFSLPGNNTAESHEEGPAKPGQMSSPRGAAGSPSSRPPAQNITQLLDHAFAGGQANYASVKSLMAALAVLESSNVEEFVSFFREFPLKREQIVLWRFFFSAWGEVDATAALAFIDERFEAPGNRRLFYLAVLDTWREDSPGGALEFAMEKLTAPQVRAQAGLALDFLRDLSKDHPEEAIKLAAQLGSEEVVFDLTARRVRQLGKDNPQAALDALASLEGEMHTHAVAQFVIDWAKEDASAAAQWLNEKYDPAMGVFPLIEVAKSFVSSDPDGALQWIRALPGEQSTGRILGEAVLAWAQTDPVEAAGWLRKLETSPEYDAAVVAVGSQLAQADPQSAIEEWVPRVSDPQQRHELLAEIAENWQRSNLAEFSNWIETTPSLTAQAKRRLLARELTGRDSAANPTGASSDPTVDQGR